LSYTSQRKRATPAYREATKKRLILDFEVTEKILILDFEVTKKDLRK
jgi:hypothetical protein